VLVTLDKDFGELAIVHGVPHYGILRLVNWAAQQQATTCLRALALYGTERTT
jgi:predicted nuclease of predicted toxin-antitoxin system